MPTVRIATWNVNSVKQRVPRFLPWLDERRPDVVCLQETKLADAAFRELMRDELSDRGYEVAVHGEAAWNGVAILSRVGLEDVAAGLEGAPGFPHPEARAVAATCAGVRVVSVYVPNGRTPGSDHYAYKLDWLGRLRQHLEKTADPATDVVVCGDFNVAPDDRDVWDPARFVGSTHVSKPERDALARLEEWGLVDALRVRHQEDRLFTYWDYRAGDFHNHRGMRIDLALVTKPLAEPITYAVIDRSARKGKLPSDHAPLLVDIAD